MADIVERLSQYNPPDRTIDEQRQMSVDIHEAADEITRLRDQLARAREFHAAELADMTAERDQLRQYLDAAQRRGEELRAQVAALREWIKHTGPQADICTRHILGEVCSYCQCGRAARKGAA